MKSRLRTGIIIALPAFSVALLIAGASRAQEDGDPVAIGTYRTLDSRVLNEERTLLVSLPRGYDEMAISCPVPYVLYGGQVRGYFAEAVHAVDRLQEAGLFQPVCADGIFSTIWNGELVADHPISKTWSRNVMNEVLK